MSTNNLYVSLFTYKLLYVYFYNLDELFNLFNSITIYACSVS